jgi:hypothetical protein
MIPVPPINSIFMKFLRVLTYASIDLSGQDLRILRASELNGTLQCRQPPTQVSTVGCILAATASGTPPGDRFW